MKPLSEEQMWDVIDGLATPDVVAQHQNLLATDADYKMEFEKALHLHQRLMHIDLEQPSMRFTQNVLDKVMPQVQVKKHKDRAPLYFLVAMFVLSTLSILLLMQLPAGSDTGLNSTIPTEGVAAWLSNPLLVRSFLILNLCLFLAILDKKVVRPFLQNKMKHSIK
jgi:hypothetical protein